MTRFLRFASAGVAGFLCDAAVFQMLIIWPGLSPYLAKVLSFFAAATATWWLNRRFTFEPSGHTAASEWMRFLGVNTFGAVLNYAVFAFVFQQMAMAAQYPLLAAMIAGALGALVGLIFNFVLSQRYVFGDLRREGATHSLPTRRKL